MIKKILALYVFISLMIMLKIDYEILNFNTNLYIGKDNGFVCRYLTLQCYSSILFLLWSDCNVYLRLALATFISFFIIVFGYFLITNLFPKDYGSVFYFFVFFFNTTLLLIINGFLQYTRK
jgi:hypothetical protein